MKAFTLMLSQPGQAGVTHRHSCSHCTILSEHSAERHEDRRWRSFHSGLSKHSAERHDRDIGTRSTLYPVEPMRPSLTMWFNGSSSTPNMSSTAKALCLHQCSKHAAQRQDSRAHLVASGADALFNDHVVHWLIIHTQNKSGPILLIVGGLAVC